MKKFTYISLAIILAFPMITLGQVNNLSFLSLDLGANSTWILNQNMYGNPELNYNLKFGFSGVASYKYFINKYGYSVGLGLINLGQKYSGNMVGADAKLRINHMYLELPVLGMYKLGDNKKQTWISFGPQLMYLLSAQQDFQRDNGQIIPEPEMLNPGSTDVISRFNIFDIMLAFEVTHIYTYKFTNVGPFKSNQKTMWALSLKSAIGLTDINSPEFRESSTRNLYAGSHNFYLGVNIGYMFNRQ